MRKKELKVLFLLSLMGVLYLGKIMGLEKVNYDKYNVEINEEIVLKQYTGQKREINSISYEDYNSINISKKKLDRIMEYKKTIGYINTVDELNKLSRITDDDIVNLKKHFRDSENKKYISVNINEADEKTLKYIGLSNYKIKKIMEYRKVKKIKNIFELEKIIGKISNVNLIF